MFPPVILPPDAPVAEGTELTIADDAEILRAPLGWLAQASLSGDLTLAYAGKSATVSSGTMLHAAWASGGDLTRADMNSPTFCLEAKYNAARGLAALFTLGISDAVSKVAKWSQFCVIDGDIDRKVEKAFLVGVKDAELRKQFLIEPVAYELKEKIPRPGEYIRILYHDGSLLGSPNLTIEIKEEGATGSLTSIYAQSDLKRKTEYRTQYKIKTKNLPQTFDIVGAKLTVLSIAKNEKSIQIRVDRNFQFSPYQSIYYHQPIVIYI